MHRLEDGKSFAFFAEWKEGECGWRDETETSVVQDDGREAQRGQIILGHKERHRGLYDVYSFKH